MQRFYAVLDADDMGKYDAPGAPPGADLPLSHNVAVAKLPLADVGRHYRNVAAGQLRGTALWLDFPFPAFPENMGHWAEALAPVYSVLSEGTWRAAAPETDGFINAVVFPNLQREQVQVRVGGPGQAPSRGRRAAPRRAGTEGGATAPCCCSAALLLCCSAARRAPPHPPAHAPQGLTWVMDMLRLSLRPGLKSPRALPRVLFSDDLSSLNASSWLNFERVLLVHNRCGAGGALIGQGGRRQTAGNEGWWAGRWCKGSCCWAVAAVLAARHSRLRVHRSLPAAGTSCPAGAAGLPSPSTRRRSGKQHTQVGDVAREAGGAQCRVCSAGRREEGSLWLPHRHLLRPAPQPPT